MPIILLLGLIAGVYLVTSGNPLKLFSKAANPPIVFKSLDGKILTNSNGVYQTTSPNVRVELTSTLGSPASVSGPVSGPNKTGTVSYRAGFSPADLDIGTFGPYTTEPTVYNIGFKNTSGVQFYWVEFKAADGRVDRRSSQIEIVNNSISRPISPTPIPTLTPVAVFRLFNPRNGDHLYTVSAQERDSASKIGYKLEGTGFYAILNDAKTPYIPVYRFYQPRTGEHFYTADQNEANTVKKYGYTQEGIAFYASASAGSNLAPVFRLINKSSGLHFYTASDAEKNSLINSGSYKLEGIAFYTPQPPISAITPTPTPIASSNLGSCVIRDDYTSLPVYSAADSGKGYAKANLGPSSKPC